MFTYIVLLRGINVGGNNILPMAELVNILESKGFENIKTYIQSGNVVLQSKQKSTVVIAKDIALSINSEKGFSPQVMVLEGKQLKVAIDHCPFDVSDGKLLHFVFLAGKPDWSYLDAIKLPTEQYKLIDGVFYFYAPNGVGRSKLFSKIEDVMGTPVTARNWNTVKKLASIIE